MTLENAMILTILIHCKRTRGAREGVMREKDVIDLVDTANHNITYTTDIF